MAYRFEPDPIVCPQSITVTLEGDIVTDVQFDGGCDGNLKAIRQLVKGMSVDEVVERFSDITCEGRGTSCAAQMALAVQQALLEHKNQLESGCS